MFNFISNAVIAFSLAVGSLFTPNIPDEIEIQQPQVVEEKPADTLGAYNPSGGGTYRLKTSIGTTNTTITLSEFEEPVSGIPYTMAYLNTSVAYGTLDPPNSTRSEFISFTGITQNADGSAILTGVTRGMARSYPYTASTTLRQAHAGQSIFILSDSPQHFSEYAIKQNDETITGQWTFTNFPITASTSYASETVVGSVELATEAETIAGTETGGTGNNLAVWAKHVPAIVEMSTPAGSILAYASTTAPTGWLNADGTAYSTTTYSTLFLAIGYTYGSSSSGANFKVPDMRGSMAIGQGTRTRTMDFAGATAVATTTDTITVTSNDWLHTGQTVVLSTSGTLPTGLSATTYYVIRSSATAIKLATSVANAVAGTAVDITAVGVGTSTLTQTLTARSLGADGGEETHALTTAELASHQHDGAFDNASGGGGTSDSVTVTAGDTNTLNAVTGFAGGSTAHQIMNPYTVLNYIIKY